MFRFWCSKNLSHSQTVLISDSVWNRDVIVPFSDVYSVWNRDTNLVTKRLDRFINKNIFMTPFIAKWLSLVECLKSGHFCPDFGRFFCLKSGHKIFSISAQSEIETSRFQTFTVYNSTVSVLKTGLFWISEFKTGQKCPVLKQSRFRTLSTCLS